MTKNFCKSYKKHYAIALEVGLLVFNTSQNILQKLTAYGLL